MSLISFLKKKISSRYKKQILRFYEKFLTFIRKDIDYFYDDRFSAGILLGKPWAESFCDIVLKIFNPRSIIDFGCGTGDILAHFQARGISVFGIDGSKACLKCLTISKNNFMLFDLRNRYKSNKKYDICICFEVGEHIEEKYSERLVENLTQSSSTILFTAAPPGQNGEHHINLKPREWWVEKFLEYSFSFDKQLTNRLIKDMEKIPNIQPCYVNNLMVFKSEEVAT